VVVYVNPLAPEFGGMPGIKGKDLIGHEGPVWNLFHGENHLFSSSSDQTVKVWDLATLKCKHTLRGHEGIVHCVVGYNKDQNVCFVRNLDSKFVLESCVISLVHCVGH
jgi:WD40 repeat protein